jgi:hypothetical protein
MLYSFLTNQSKRALIFLIPGYGSPAAADANIATIFANNGYAVFDIEPEGSIQFNVRLEFYFSGQGNSEGLPGYLHSFTTTLNDILRFIRDTRAQYPSHLKAFLFGYKQM